MASAKNKSVGGAVGVMGVIQNRNKKSMNEKERAQTKIGSNQYSTLKIGTNNAYGPGIYCVPDPQFVWRNDLSSFVKIPGRKETFVVQLQVAINPGTCDGDTFKKVKNATGST
eukprot:UN32050